DVTRGTRTHAPTRTPFRCLNGLRRFEDRGPDGYLHLEVLIDESYFGHSSVRPLVREVRLDTRRVGDTLLDLPHGLAGDRGGNRPVHAPSGKLVSRRRERVDRELDGARRRGGADRSLEGGERALDRLALGGRE